VYQPLRALMSIEESLAHPEVRIHEYGDGPNVHKNVALQFGDVEAAFARADLVREDVFFFEGNTHLPMAQHAAVAHCGPDGKLSQVTGRPVKITLTREEVFYVHRGRHPVLMWIKTGFTRQGDITGCHLKTWLDGGAYGSYGVASTFYTGVINPVTYKMPVYK